MHTRSMGPRLSALILGAAMAFLVPVLPATALDDPTATATATATVEPTPDPTPTDPTPTDPTPTDPTPTDPTPSPTTSPFSTSLTPTATPSPSSTFQTTLEPTTFDTTTSTGTALSGTAANSSSITTGGGAMMAALIKINTAEARCEANAATEAAVVTINSELVPASVGTFVDDQVVNAAIVVGVGLELGVPERGQVIAVMTAIAESGLSPVDEEVKEGPDSAGLFQQGAGGSWGTRADRVDPATSARNFYAKLVTIPGWDAMEPTLAADAVQRGEDPNVYAGYWDQALEMVRTLSTGAVTATMRPCVTEFGALSNGTAAWASPVVGRITSPFGYRVHPVLGITAQHTGTDVAAMCGTPVTAAADGIVVWAGGGLQGRTGNQVVVYHGDGVLTRYGHLLSGTVLVSVGATVTRGQQLASVGGDATLDPGGAGNSTGCHLHFETNRDNGSTAVDPTAFLADRGVALGRD